MLEDDGVSVTLALCVTVAVWVEDGVGDTDDVLVDDGVSVTLAVWVTVGVPDPDCVTDGDAPWEAVDETVGLCVLDAVRVTEGVLLCD